MLVGCLMVVRPFHGTGGRSPWQSVAIVRYPAVYPILQCMYAWKRIKIGKWPGPPADAHSLVDSRCPSAELTTRIHKPDLSDAIRIG